ncbi:MAG: YidB family protein [Thiobacillaceae bacterium]|nr:YidB family protein [Thiobacillaceae bacterium]
MGLFDGAIGDVLNNLGGGADAGSGGNPMLRMITSLMQQNGGLGGLVDLLSKNGLGRQAASWVGTGDNEPVTADQLGQALGSGPLADLAGKFGIDAQTLSGGLAQYLPDVVNQLTPEGRLPDNVDSGDLLEKGLAALAGKLFR